MHLELFERTAYVHLHAPLAYAPLLHPSSSSSSSSFTRPSTIPMYLPIYLQADDLRRHSLSDGQGGHYGTNLDRNRYGSDNNYLFTVTKYNLDRYVVFFL
jgi:hypothetical protein